ncbi:MAG TPA: hypothetical protein VF544_17790 [Pyrinomonadaceae bacterium]|jgi:hypothetical protein
MDLMKLRQALAMLNAFAASLPNGDIEEKYVALYHKTLDDIRAQTNQDLSYFHIPQSELEPHVTSISRGPRGRGPSVKNYSEEHYCDRERFLMSLRGAINFINALTLDSGATTLPLIEPPK